jgi:hypothetical protein
MMLVCVAIECLAEVYEHTCQAPVYIKDRLRRGWWQPGILVIDGYLVSMASCRMVIPARRPKHCRYRPDYFKESIYVTVRIAIR